MATPLVSLALREAMGTQGHFLVLWQQSTALNFSLMDVPSDYMVPRVLKHLPHSARHAEYPEPGSFCQRNFSRLPLNTSLGFLCDCCLWPREHTLLLLS
jgi:hypothetical protein